MQRTEVYCPECKKTRFVYVRDYPSIKICRECYIAKKSVTEVDIDQYVMPKPVVISTKQIIREAFSNFKIGKSYKYKYTPRYCREYGKGTVKLIQKSEWLLVFEEQNEPFKLNYKFSVNIGQLLAREYEFVGVKG